jgi:ubiquinone/menaquinone biosynthesis C-methylase UbiE
MGKDYYERYWSKEFANRKGFANLPPEHTSQNLQRIINSLKPYVHGRVLDVGCGDGFVTNLISKFPGVAEIFGLDISQTAINIGKSKYTHIKFEVGSVTNLPFAANYFDVITAIEVVEHINNTEQLFKEFNRVLRLNGRLFITTTDFNLLKKIIIALFFWERYFYPTNPHIRFFTKKTLSAMLAEHGFEIKQHRWNGSYFGIMPKGQIMIAEKVKEA